MFDYKTVKHRVPWCKTCDSEIEGNGSGIMPYECKCGIYEYDGKHGYALIPKKSVKEY